MRTTTSDQPPDPKGLLRLAPASFSSVLLICEGKYWTEALVSAQNAWLMEVGDSAEWSPLARPAEPRRMPHNGPATLGWRVWWQRPDRWRDEITWEGGVKGVSVAAGGRLRSFVIAADGTRRESASLVPNDYAPSGKDEMRDARAASLLRRLRELPLLDPSCFLSGWNLSSGEPTSHIGRRAWRCTASASPTATTFLWRYVRDYSLVIDDERGVVLQCTGWHHGAPVGSLSVTTAHFDVPLDDALFLV